MDIISFFSNVGCVDFFQKYKTICFSGSKEKCPVLFFSLLLRQLKKNISDSVHTIDCLHQELSGVSAKLATSFLGSSTIFLCTNSGQLKPKKKKQFLEIIKMHRGPNAILFFVDETFACTKNDVDLLIQLPEKINQRLFVKLAAAFSKKISEKTAALLFGKIAAIDLDVACLLLQYFDLLGKNIDDFAQQWLCKLIEPEHSLQSLSGSFFAKNRKSFFSLWQVLGKEYPAQFWISFWSEQLWRAFYFVQYSKKRQFIDAKRISYRLPYSFVQGDWRRSNVVQLRDAHQLLYDIDCSLKNGGHERALELVYTNFFSFR